MIPLTEMVRVFYLSLWVAVAYGQEAQRAFEKVPFDQWLKEREGARIHWSMRVIPARLTEHQRLGTALVVDIDGDEFVKRNKPGQLAVFLEVRDAKGQPYRNYRPMVLPNESKVASVATVNVAQFFFVTPGDFSVAAVIYDKESQEHSLKRMKVKVPELSHDPLPGSWKNLPSVEFFAPADPPDGWYMPDLISRLSLPVQTEKPVRIEVVVNESPSETPTGRPGRMSRRNMGTLVPALKVISQMEMGNGSMNLTLLDLERRRVSFKQEEVRTLDWPRLRGALIENDPDKIDVHSMENHEQNAQFFVSEIRKLLESTESNGDVPLGLSAEPARVLIVLSGPMSFAKGQDLRPIEATPEPGTRVFYIRYYPPRPGIRLGPSGAPFGGERGAVLGLPPTIAGRGRGVPIEDLLARTLKPLAPRTFDVTTPEEFRSALAAIMSEISRLK
jgi:hypothetical protein